MNADELMYEIANDCRDTEPIDFSRMSVKLPKGKWRSTMQTLKDFIIKHKFQHCTPEYRQTMNFLWMFSMAELHLAQGLSPLPALECILPQITTQRISRINSWIYCDRTEKVKRYRTGDNTETQKESQTQMSPLSFAFYPESTSPPSTVLNAPLPPDTRVRAMIIDDDPYSESESEQEQKSDKN